MNIMEKLQFLPHREHISFSYCNRSVNAVEEKNVGVFCNNHNTDINELLTGCRFFHVTADGGCS